MTFNTQVRAIHGFGLTVYEVLYFKMVPGLSPKTSGLSPSGIFEKKSSHQSSETISIDSNHSRRKSWEPAIEKILLSPQPSVIVEKPKLIFYSPCNVPVTPMED